MTTFLTLAPEFGGTRFGPFKGPIHVGSDPGRCQLVLSPHHGILPVHATIAQQPDGSYALGPTQAGAGLFMIQSGKPDMWPVRGAVQANAGDMLIFGTPNGPRFTIQVPPGAKVPGVPEAAPAAPSAGGGGSSFAQGMQNEVQRRIMAKLITKSPFRDIYYFVQRARVGTFTNPYYVVGAIVAVFGAIAAGGLSCTGILGAIWASLMY